MSARLTLILTVGMTLLPVGCGSAPDARFVYNQRTNGLIPEARKPLEETLVEDFGTPMHLVAWLRMPVDYGRLEGAVVPGNEGAGNSLTRAFDVDFAGKVEYDLGGLGLLWLSGAYKDLSTQVADYNDKTGELRLADNLEAPPQAGDNLLVVGHVLQEGRRQYMTHCQHCHGVSGDGAGPTAKYLNPPPRDYRLGLFKFTSTKQQEKVSRADLSQIIKQGIPGTYMPSFMLLEDDQLSAIIEYVRWLALRGEFENKLDAEFEGDYSKEAVKQRIEQGESKGDILAALNEFVTDEFPGISDEAATDLAEAWQQADEQESVIVPTKKRTHPDPASLARGRALYLSAKAKCATCHGVTGLGNGPQTEDVQKGYTEPGIFDDWKNKIEPRNLTRGIYRGGRRPVDLYRRIYAGIKGTPMPAFGGTVLNDDEIWDLVNYVMSIPFAKEGSSGSTEKSEIASQPQSAVRGDHGG